MKRIKARDLCKHLHPLRESTEKAEERFEVGMVRSEGHLKDRRWGLAKQPSWLILAASGDWHLQGDK